MNCSICGREMMHEKGNSYYCSHCDKRGSTTAFWVMVFVLAIYLLVMGIKKANSQTIFDNCGPHGDAKPNTREFALNVDKNRSAVPSHPPRKIEGTVILVRNPAISTADYVQLTGYIAEVKSGGLESCNCHTKDMSHRDIHIALVFDPKYKDNDSRYLIVEMTPRFMGQNGWTAKTIKQKYLHKWVTVSGWLFNDSMHLQNALLTNPSGSSRTIWRNTSWEIHPVTSIKLATRP